MEHPLLIFGLLFNWLGLGDFTAKYPHVIYSWVAIIFLLIIGYLGGKTVKVIPGRLQNVVEVLIDGIEKFQVSIMGDEGRPYFPLIASIGLYVFTCNIMGLFPGFLSPTANLNTTLSCALVTFFATHYVGVKMHGVKYIKHFMGPLLPLAPLMIVIETIGHLARVLSLTLRLFGNVMGEDLVLATLFFLGGQFFAPLPMMFLGMFTCFIQAFIFALLSMLYISGAMEEAH